MVAEETFVVEPLPLWAFGTFNGWIWSSGDDIEDIGAASLNVTAAGKIAGKMSVLGKTWTFSTTGFDVASAEKGASFETTVEVKQGSSRKVMRLKISPDGSSNCSYVECLADDAVAGLRRSVWKDKPLQWNIFKAKFNLGEFGLPAVNASVATSGKVTFSGKLPDGRKVSCLSTVFVDEDGNFLATLIVPQKKGVAGFMLDVPVLGAEVAR